MFDTLTSKIETRLASRQLAKAYRKNQKIVVHQDGTINIIINRKRIEK